MKYIPPRDGYGEALLQLAESQDKLIVLDADVAKSTRTAWVAEKFPEKFIDVGISEQDMVGIAAGLSVEGFIPFISTYGVFLSGRAFDQIRTTVCYDNMNVKFAGAHAGISVGPDGATHQALEDMALMSVLPHMTLLAPCDSIEARKATLAMYLHRGPCYIRFGREACPVITDENSPFEIGRANVLREGSDCSVFACGLLVSMALEAAETLGREGISVSVINVHTIKPLDEKTILEQAKKTGKAVVAQEHQITGGLCGMIAQFLAEKHPIPLKFIGVHDSFGESGAPNELLQKYGLSASAIAEAVRGLVKNIGKKND